jgi:hypothetical protein
VGQDGLKRGIWRGNFLAIGEGVRGFDSKFQGNISSGTSRRVDVLARTIGTGRSLGVRTIWIPTLYYKRKRGFNNAMKDRLIIHALVH